MNDIACQSWLGLNSLKTSEQDRVELERQIEVLQEENRKLSQDQSEFENIVKMKVRFMKNCSYFSNYCNAWYVVGGSGRRCKRAAQEDEVNGRCHKEGVG